jgi:hypothetical protein
MTDFEKNPENIAKLRAKLEQDYGRTVLIKHISIRPDDAYWQILAGKFEVQSASLLSAVCEMNKLYANKTHPKV